MPIILAKIIAGRPPEKLERFIEAVTAAASEVLDAPPESVRVIIEEVPKTHWGIGGKSAKALGK